MPDKYNITELIPTNNKNKISALLTFSGTVGYCHDRLSELDAALYGELATGTTVFQTIWSHWRLGIRSVIPLAHLSAPAVFVH
jgi:hypothetical protein